MGFGFIQSIAIYAALLLAPVIVFGWPVPIFLGIRALRRGGPGARRRGTAVLLVGLVWAGGAENLLNWFLNERDKAARASCACNLSATGMELAAYADNHGGKPASDLQSVVRAGFGPNYLVCPLGSRYAYRPLAHPKPDDIVAWDSKPHPDRRRLLLFATAWRRNVLQAGGRCHSLAEEEFQALQRKWKPQSAK